MQQFNKLPEEKGWLTRGKRRSSSTSGEQVELQPLVYVTYQAYLKRLVTINEGSLIVIESFYQNACPPGSFTCNFPKEWIRSRS